MLTLKELKKIVKVADVEKRIPSVKSLKEHKVVVKEMINADTTISVYDHGYVLYTAGNQSTVFPLHSCDDYEYVSVTGDNKEFNKEFFDNENWYIRLLMEAEDRMAYSQSKISTNHGVFSNSDVTDDAEIMRGSSKDFVDDVIDREILNAYKPWWGYAGILRGSIWICRTSRVCSTKRKNTRYCPRNRKCGL